MKQDLKRKKKEIACFRVQELCGSRGGRLGLPVPYGLYCLCGRSSVSLYDELMLNVLRCHLTY